MTKEREALKLAASALKNCRATGILDDQTWRQATLALVYIDKALDHPSDSVEQEPVLKNIEQYRLQMAGISTAALGYWKESDDIHSAYDTLALRDVAKLYAKYDELYKAQPKPLTAERLDEIESEILQAGGDYAQVLRAVADEAKLKELNA